ncbi:hypothetical protein IWW38_001232 [Coemansia aciculifera]|uniref:Uncharacterized protein n=1 Tax=Coemansia aciculifera TaxID=417176 RepID=A0ACC1M8M2_9FUNG|nr:hypothetical protein IWW38_001232 [Coemansia aciculifera]
MLGLSSASSKQGCLLGLAATGRSSCWRRTASCTAVLNWKRRVSTALLDRRIELWNKERERQQRDSESQPMSLTAFGSIREAVANVSTPLDLARKYDQKRAKGYIAAVTNGTTMWDMQRPLLPETSKLECLTFEDGGVRAKEVFWHSSAHLLGAALERIYGDDIMLCDGPALPEGGFFYEFLLLDPSKHSAASRLRRDVSFTERIAELCGTRESLGGLRFLSTADMDQVHKVAMDIASEKHVFEHMDVDYSVACDLFFDNPFKLHFLSRARSQSERQGGTSAVFGLYKCGNMVDLCRGPHIVHTAQIQALAINRVSSAHWVGHLGDGGGGSVSGGTSSPLQQQTAPVLNRVYGISFPTQVMLKNHQQQIEEAARRDHRVIGKEQKLFMMHPWAPGSGFILPHGQRMVNTVMTTIRRRYAKYGFDEVSTPLMYNRRLWETSGHWENYRDDMFAISNNKSDAKEGSGTGCCGHSHGAGDGEPEFGLKPMNCPGHCLIFASEQRSYKDLPIRYADFSPLHRNEIAGALSGLTRVRKFHQDDGHVFCAREQVADEIAACLRLVDEMYEVFGFASSYELALSTRPQQSFMGEISEWDEAESALKEALERSGRAWTLNEGDGAFYGPKIDVRVQDALGRRHQTATIQLDFQLPQRFQLKYTGSDGKPHRPVMIHRAVLGSMERMLAILIEHWGGKWPFWINPRQAIVIPTTTADAEIVDYAQMVRSKLAGDRGPASVDSHRFFVDVDVSGNTMNRAVREAQVARYGFILVVGEKELRSGTVDVRRCEGGRRVGAMTISDARAMFQDLVETYK